MKKFLKAFAVMIVFSVCSCGEKNTENIPVPVTQTMYKEEHLNMPEDYNIFEYMEYAENLERHYIIYNDFSDNIKLCILDSDFKTESTEILCKRENITECMHDISPDGEISQLKYICDYDFPENGEFDEQDYISNAVLSFELAKYDSSGNLISETVVDGMEKYYNLTESRINGLVRNGDTYTANFYTSLVKFSSDGKITDTVQSDKGIDFSGTDNSGKLAVGEFKTLSFYEENSLKNISEKIETDNYLSICGSLRRGTNGFRMYMRMNEGYFGLTESNEFIKILDFSKSNIISLEVYEICIGSEGRIMMYGCSSSGMTYISVLTARPDDYVENKKTVILGVEDTAYDDLNAVISRFNKRSDEYIVECKSYGGDYDEFNRDLISGNAPDLFVYSQTSKMYQYADSEVFLNMYDLMKKYGGFSKDDVRENVINAFEYKNGLYGICSQYYIMTCIANSEVVGKEYENWSYEDMYEITENLPEGMTLSNNESLNTRTQVFEMFGGYNTRAWIDYENSSCSFDSEKFIKFLEFCRDVPMLPERDYSSLTQEEQELVNQETHSMLKNKKSLLTSEYIMSLSSLSDLSQIRSMDIENITFLGIPDDNHSGIISSNHIYSVISNGSCTEGAWEYINYIMSAEYQQNTPSMYSGYLATRKDISKKSAGIYQHNSADSKTYFYGNPLSDEVYRDFIKYLDTCDTLIYRNGYITYIMDEEFNEFINGNISAEECAERIQSRVSIYLSEQS